jgi:precorrin-2/cobalt-factor-2 C20-methyltransferase
VLMKVSRDFDQIVQTIDVHDKHGVFVSRCGSEQQAVVRDLNTLVGKSVDYLSLILVKNNPVEEGAHSK